LAFADLRRQCLNPSFQRLPSATLEKRARASMNHRDRPIPVPRCNPQLHSVLDVAVRLENLCGPRHRPPRIDATQRFRRTSLQEMPEQCMELVDRFGTEARIREQAVTVQIVQ